MGRTRITLHLRNSALTFVTLLMLGTAATPAEKDKTRPAVPGGFASRVVKPASALDSSAGEDGTPYSPSPEVERTSWLLGKIEPVVEQDAATTFTLDVILYLNVPAARAGEADPAAVKARHQSAIDDLGRRIRDLEHRYQPRLSLPEEQETAAAAQLEAAMSLPDRDTRNHLRAELDRRLDAMRADLGRVFRARSAALLDAMSEEVASRGGQVNRRLPMANALGVTIPSTALLALAERPEVALVVKNNPVNQELNVSMPSARFDTWWDDTSVNAGGFCGGIWDGGMVDSGLQQDHPGFAGINFFNTTGSVTDTDGHGTHVAGIIAGRNLTYRGAAPCLDSFIWGSWAGGEAGTMADMDEMMTTLGQAPEVVNVSGGWGIVSSDYRTNDSFFDAFITNFDVMVTKSAGNEGWDTSPTLTNPASTFNLMAVANMDDLNTTGRSDDVRRPSSSIGPTIGGRRKPDITAPGHNIISTNAFWPGIGAGTDELCKTPSNHNDYVTCSGTSMAAPHVAGAIVLMEDGGNHNPAAQKAVLINTADWWTSANTDATLDDGQVTTAAGIGNSRWDIAYGWGYLDAAEAHFNRGNYFTGTLVPRNTTPTEDDYKLYVGTLFPGEKATLVWEKRGVYAAGAPASTTYGLSDLNLRLYNESTGALVDYDLDPDDNVHQVAAAATITAVIKPYAWSTGFAGAATEAFALATEENFDLASFPQTFQGLASWPASLQPNEEADITFSIRNDSTLTSHDNDLDLVLPAGWTLVSGSDPLSVGKLGGGGGTSIPTLWRVRAPGVDGPYTVTSQHRHTSYDVAYGPYNWDLPITVVTDVTPPAPNPLVWLNEPATAGTTSLTMTAATATDPHGPVQYQFDHTSSPTGGIGGSDSAWQASASHGDAGLVANHEYCYRARARDNPMTTANLTAYTPTSCQYTGIETPTGITFGAVGTTSIEASSTNTPSGLTRGSSGLIIHNDTAVANSGWRQDNSPWTSLALSPNTAYTFRTQARNGDALVTPFSPSSSRYTLASAPAASALTTVTDTSIGANWLSNGNPGGTEYFAENSTTAQNSGWTTAATWNDTGLVCGSAYTYRVKARNGDGVETIWVSLGSRAAGIDTDGDTLPDCVDADDDNDGAQDSGDCAPVDPGRWSIPGEVPSLTVTTVAGGTAILNWVVPAAPGGIAVLYDVVASRHPSGLLPSAFCVETDGTDLMATDGAAILPGQVFRYLVRGGNGCGEGSAGTQSSGAPRVVRVCP